MKRIAELKIVPVIAISDASKAAGLADALISAGLPIAEVTLRTPSSLESLREIASRTEILTGAGSLRNESDLNKAIDAGAQFAVSAGFSSAIAKEAAKLNIPYFPGVATPTEILQAIDAGITTLKFFPAETLGGIAALKAMSAPFPGINFMPTGGINIENMNNYLAYGPVVAVGGSWMVAQKLIDGGEFTEIEKLTKDALKAVTA
jgi:2-dehydro-3-deoxyphosphogluconate aldolase/(4S)-4-hydroxy-2-oxoglutarate aldolase